MAAITKVFASPCAELEQERVIFPAIQTKLDQRRCSLSNGERVLGGGHRVATGESTIVTEISFDDAPELRRGHEYVSPCTANVAQIPGKRVGLTDRQPEVGEEIG
jgi:hypothetical protein